MPSASDLKSVVEFYEAAGEFETTQAADALKVHLTAVSHFEDIESTEQVIEHMEEFHQLLEHQKAEGLISYRAYNILKTDADVLIAKWESL